MSSSCSPKVASVTGNQLLCDGVDVREDADRGGDCGCNSTDDCGYSGDRTPTATGADPATNALSCSIVRKRSV